jgi:hypothetical protein
MMQKLPLKKLVLEMRYKPDVGFYGKMDSFGTEFAGDFPDWERSPLTLELRDKKKHRRLYLSVKRLFIDVDEPDRELDLGFAERLAGKIVPRLGVKDFIAQLKWKDYSEAQLKAIRGVLDIGYRQVWVTHEDYAAARSRCAEGRVDPSPRIDLGSLKWEDIEDVDE